MTRAPDSPSKRELTAVPRPSSLDVNGSAPSTDKAADPESSPSADAESAPRVSFWKVLQNRNFLFLWAGQVFSQLADKVYLVLMIALITSRFQEEGQTVSGWVSSVMVAFTIPAVLFGSFAGVLVDRWPKKWTMVSTNVLRGVLVLILPALLWATRAQGDFLHVPLGFWAVLGTTFFGLNLNPVFLHLLSSRPFHSLWSVHSY